jgi:hypothetical protein
MVFGLVSLWRPVTESTAGDTDGEHGASFASGTPGVSPRGVTGRMPAPPSAPSPSTPPSTSSTSSTSSTQGRCAEPATGSPIDCTATAAWLAVDPRPCTTESLLTRWGVDQEINSLLVVVTSAGRRCWTAPAAQALAAGARTPDLDLVSASSAPAVLRACARGQLGDVTVSCAQEHELEWVGRWRSVGPEEPEDRCSVLGRRYTDSSLSGAAGRIEPLVVQGRRSDGSRVYRCALRVRGTTLAGSLHDVGDGPLPTTRPGG